MFCWARLLTLSFVSFSLLRGIAPAAEPIDLSPRVVPQSVVRVSIEVEAGGSNLVRAENETTGKEEEKKLPMSVAANLQYDERCLATNATVANGTPLAARYYDRAEATIKVDESGRKPTLADDRKLVVLEAGTDRASIYCPNGPLTREQLDLIDVVGNSYYVDRLLPTKPVTDGESWAADATVMGPLLSLDTVAACEVQSVLDGSNPSFAKIRLAGTVTGTADGAATEMEVRAVYLFDRKLQRVTRLNLAVRERRSIGGATPGCDAVAKLQIKIEPIQNSTKLGDDVIAKLATAGRSPIRDLIYESGPMGFRVKHDRQWFVTSEQRESVTMRRVDRGDLVAQCTLSALPPKSAGRQTSLEQFQKDVTYSLGKNFGEMVSSREWQNAAGHYCYELVARGIVQDVPVEWHYFLIAPESGNRISAAVTLEKPMIDRVAKADRDLIESLELFPRMPAAQAAVQPARGNRK